MVKARTLTISRSERFFGTHGTRHVEDHGVELGEDEVWSMVDDLVNGGNDWTSRPTSARSHRAGVLPSASTGGLSVAFDDHHQPLKTSQRIIHQSRNGSDTMASPHGRHVATSAPVNVPDWSKIYRVDSVESMHDSDDGTEDHESDMVPPHEYLARSHRSAAKSVFEGVGRTLKGRDMSRVRDAVWSQTGFDG